MHPGLTTAAEPAETCLGGGALAAGLFRTPLPAAFPFAFAFGFPFGAGFLERFAKASSSNSSAVFSCLLEEDASGWAVC